MTSNVIVEADGPILRIVLDRPEKKNALTGEMYLALIQAFERAEEQQAGALVIEGSGGVFTAGNDIGDFLAYSEHFETAPALRFIRALAANEMPLVAAVEGDAVGIGATMLLHCDLVYAAPSARFRFPFVDLGLVPEAAASLLLPRRVGLARASEILMLADAFGAEEAARLGLVNAIAPADALSALAVGKAKRLAQKSRAALRATRQLLRGDRAEILSRIDEEANEFARLLRSEDAPAAIRAFTTRTRRETS